MLQTGLYVYLAFVFVFFGGGFFFCLCVGSVCALINEALVRSRPARPHCWFMHRQRIVAVPRTGRRTCFARARVASPLAFVLRVALEAHIGPVSPRNEPSFAPHFKPCYASPNRRQRAAGVPSSHRASHRPCIGHRAPRRCAQNANSVPSSLRSNERFRDGDAPPLHALPPPLGGVPVAHRDKCGHTVACLNSR